MFGRCFCREKNEGLHPDLQEACDYCEEMAVRQLEADMDDYYRMIAADCVEFDEESRLMKPYQPEMLEVKDDDIPF